MVPERKRDENLGRTERSMVRAMCGEQFKDRKRRKSKKEARCQSKCIIVNQKTTGLRSGQPHLLGALPNLKLQSLSSGPS